MFLLDPWPSSTCPKISQYIFFMYTLGAFQTAPSVLGLWLSDIACWPFKSRDSVSYGPFVLLELSHTDFQSRISWELLFPLQVPRANPTQA